MLQPLLVNPPCPPLGRGDHGRRTDPQLGRAWPDPGVGLAVPEPRPPHRPARPAGPHRPQRRGMFILSSIYSVANAIAVNGTDVFIAGNINATHATYWKNGIPTSLGDGQANAIFITDK